MADCVGYVVECYCGETIYAAFVPRDFLTPIQKVRVEYYPDLMWPNCHDPITECKGCGRNIKRVEDQQYQEAVERLDKARADFLGQVLEEAHERPDDN